MVRTGSYSSWAALKTRGELELGTPLESDHYNIIGQYELGWWECQVMYSLSLAACQQHLNALGTHFSLLPGDVVWVGGAAQPLRCLFAHGCLHGQGHFYLLPPTLPSAPKLPSTWGSAQVSSTGEHSLPWGHSHVPVPVLSRI